MTGKIAAKLYPQAKVQIKGFEETSFPQDYFDVVVGNVPFGGYGVYDSEYSRQKFMIHDYFIAKSIDRVKPNRDRGGGDEQRHAGQAQSRGSQVHGGAGGTTRRDPFAEHSIQTDGEHRSGHGYMTMNKAAVPPHRGAWN